MSAHIVGYARVSTSEQDLTAQRNQLSVLGVPEDRIYTDHGLTGTNRDRPGLSQALAAVRDGDTLVITKLDRLARSLPDARDIMEELTQKNVKLSIGGSIHDPADPVGRLLFNVLAMVAEFESTSSVPAPGRACRWPKPRAGYAGSSPNSPKHRKLTWSLCIREDNTPLPRSRSSLKSREAPCIASSSGHHRSDP